MLLLMPSPYRLNNNKKREKLKQEIEAETWNKVFDTTEKTDTAYITFRTDTKHFVLIDIDMPSMNTRIGLPKTKEEIKEMISELQNLIK